MSTYIDGQTGVVVEIEPLDTLIYRGRFLDSAWPFVHLTSLGIQVFTGSCWVHAATAMRGRLQGLDQVRTLVTDATEDGIDVRPLSADLRRGRRVGVLRPPGEHRVDEVALAAFVWARWGVAPYGTRKLLANAWVEIAGGSSKPDPEEIPDDFICSEWSSVLLRKFVIYPGGRGFDPCPDYADRFTSPADLAKRSVLRWVTTDLGVGGSAAVPVPRSV